MKDKVKKIIKEAGADLVGIASVDRFERALPGCTPTDILPRAEAVIAIAGRIPRGSLESGNMRLVTNAWNMVNAELNKAAYKGARFLEDHGHLAAVIPAFLPIEMLQRHGLVGDLSLKHAAAMAGIGILGFSGLLLTPQFGPRQRLSAVVTDAPLEPDPLLKEDFCAQCTEKNCVRACPAEAIKGNTKGIEKLKCLDRYQKFGGRALVRFLRKLIETPDAEERIKLLKFPTVLEFYELHQFLRVGGVACAECMRACPVGT